VTNHPGDIGSQDVTSDFGHYSGIADLRNAMAHGVITSVDGLDTPVCVKFGRRKDGFVQVEEKYALTLEWIGEQTNRAYEAGRFVVERVQELALKFGAGT
jgi:hypothetical protein